MLEAIQAEGTSKALKILDVSLNKITSTGIGLLVQIFSLYFLTVRANQINDESMYHFQTYNTLQLLDISNNSITDAGIKLLSSHSHLKFLAIENNKITPKSFKYLAKMPALEELWVADNNLSGQGLHYLIQSKSLISLNLESNQFTSKDVLPLAEMCLTSLNVTDNLITAEGALVLRQINTLKTLYLRDNIISDEDKTILQEDNPIKIANNIRQRGYIIAVPTLRRIGIFCMKNYTKNSRDREKILALLPDDLKNELQSKVDLIL